MKGVDAGEDQDSPYCVMKGGTDGRCEERDGVRETTIADLRGSMSFADPRHSNFKNDALEKQ